MLEARLVLYRSYLKLDNEVKAVVRTDPICQRSMTVAEYFANHGGIIQLGAHFIDRAAQELADEFCAAFAAHVERIAKGRPGSEPG